MTAAQRHGCTVKIASDNHTIEITGTVRQPEELTELARKLFDETRPQPEPRQQIGFAGQSAERRWSPGVDPVGNGRYSIPTGPVIATGGPDAT